MKTLLSCSFAALLCLPAVAQPSDKTYAQSLIEREVARHPELLSLAMHVAAPKGAQHTVIAAKDPAQLGQAATAETLDVVRTGKPWLHVGGSGERVDVQLVLRDMSRRPLGSLEMALPFRPGDSEPDALKKAQIIRDDLARRISHAANLMEPARMDVRVPTDTYAQHLVDETLAKHPELLIVAFHATPPKHPGNVIVASNIGRIGKPADEDDLGVIASGVPKLELNADGDRFESLQVLQDVSGDTIGAVGFVFAYRPGDDQAAMHRKAVAIRDGLRRRILSIGNLMDPFPYDAAAPVCRHAQKLVDDTMARHAGLLVVAMHAKAPGNVNYPIIASNIGRIGKKADEDDMRVIETGRPNLEVSENGKRFEVALVLQDRAKQPIGALGLVFPYKPGDDQAALERQAQAIRNDLGKRIPSAAKLCKPA